MNYDLDTKQGMANAIAWTNNLVDSLSDGGVWVVPRSGTFIRVDKKHKIATITAGFVPDNALNQVFKAMGWQVNAK